MESPGRLHRPLLTRSQSDNSSSTVIATLDVPESTIRPAPAPERPPRNPARPLTSLPPPPPPVKPEAGKGKAKERPRTATGTREEVTPWELHPPPPEPIMLTQSTSSSSKRTVTVTNSPRPSSSHGSGHSASLSFADLSILRRRKSTGSKPVKPKGSNTVHLLHKSRPGHGSHSPPTRIQQSSSMSQDRPYALPPPQPDPLTRPLVSPRSAPTAPRLSDKITAVVSPHPHPASHHSQSTSVSTHAPLHSLHPPRVKPSSQPQFGSHLAAAHRAFTSTLNASSPVANHTSSTTSTTYFPPQSKAKPPRTSSERQNELKFSTADRTILEELKRNIRARAAQFVVKGPGIHVEPSSSRGGNLGVGTGLTMGGLGSIGTARKHHPYSKEVVPYPRSYEREVLDLDVWETLSCQQICESLTWHSFEKPPTKVLDIGCGTGTWILDCARAWRHCHFVGLDTVPLHPDLQQVGSKDLAHRVTWVQSNFLEGLPFPNEEFDFVHIKRIAMGVPEDKWDSLFEEITRVMKPGAAFEMIEEDLFFPGRVDHGEDSDSDSDLGSESRTPLHFDELARLGTDLKRRRSTTTSTRRPPRRDSALNTANRLSLSGAELGLGFGNSSGLGLTFGNDAERTNGLVESERENENEHDSDSLMTSSGGSRRTSSVSGRISDDIVGFGSPVSALASSTMSTNSSLLASIGSNSVKGNNSSAFPSTNSVPPASPPTLSPKSPLPLSPPLPALPMITTASREVGLIVEDEEGEKSASQDTSPEDNWNKAELETESYKNQPQKPSHVQESTEATITPATFEPTHSMSLPKSAPTSSSHTSLPSTLASSTPRSPKSPNIFHTHLMADTTNPTTTNSFPPPIPPRSSNSSHKNGGPGLHLSLHFPSKAFSQTKLPLASHNTSLPSFHANASMSSDTLAGPGAIDTTIKLGGGATISPPTANSKSPVSPFLFRALPKPPVNPRDHSVLELIWNEMQASRFINLSPLSILPNLLNMHFKDVRTHPPLLFNFPPQSVGDEQQSRESSADRSSDPDEEIQDAIRSTHPAVARPLRNRRSSNATFVSPRTAGSPSSPNPPTHLHLENDNDSEYDHWVTIRGLLQHDSPYITFDGSRSSAFSPSTRASFFSKPPAKAKPSKTEPNAEGRSDYGGAPVNSWAAHSASMMKSRLPNTTMHIDLRSLNLQLAVRVAEVLACSETMWEWVLEYQKKVQDEKREQSARTTHRIRSRSIDVAPVNVRSKATSDKGSDRLKSAVVELTREDYDNLLRRFYMDMYDHMAIPSALSERFSWNVFASPPTEERKSFDAECERYLQWEMEQRQRVDIGHRERSPLPRQRPLSASLATPPMITSSLPLTLSVDELPLTRSEVRLPLPKGVPDDGPFRRESALSMSKSQLSHTSSKASTVPSARRMSRAMRVFVAWKQ